MSKTTTYLLRDIPKDFWGKVRNLAYEEGITIKELIMEELGDAIEREKSREEAEQTLKGKNL